MTPPIEFRGRNPIASHAIEFRPFLAGDVVQVALSPSQRREWGYEQELDLDYGYELASRSEGFAWTGIANGRVVGCAGLAVTFPPAQAMAWALLPCPIGPAHLAISRFARAMIASSPFARVEAFVLEANRAAVRWAQLVGLRPGYVLEKYGCAAERHILFERIAA